MEHIDSVSLYELYDYDDENNSQSEHKLSDYFTQYPAFQPPDTDTTTTTNYLSIFKQIINIDEHHHILNRIFNFVGLHSLLSGIVPTSWYLLRFVKNNFDEILSSKIIQADSKFCCICCAPLINGCVYQMDKSCSKLHSGFKHKLIHCNSLACQATVVINLFNTLGYLHVHNYIGLVVKIPRSSGQMVNGIITHDAPLQFNLLSNNKETILVRVYFIEYRQNKQKMMFKLLPLADLVEWNYELMPMLRVTIPNTLITNNQISILFDIVNNFNHLLLSKHEKNTVTTLEPQFTLVDRANRCESFIKTVSMKTYLSQITIRSQFTTAFTI